MKRSLVLPALLTGLAAAAPPPPSPNYAPETVVVFNHVLPESKRLAELYAKVRGIPAANLVALPASSEETITRKEFEATLETPLRNAFTARGWWKVEESPDGVRVASANSRRVLAVMRGIPLRISEESPAPGQPGPQTGDRPPAPAPAAMKQNNASVDSELSMLGLVGKVAEGAINNPYYNKDEAFSTAMLPMMLLVGRIDGPSVKVCERMINEAAATERTGLWGRAYLDLARKGGAYDEGDSWILGAGRALGTGGWPVTIDAHPQTFPTNYPMTDAAVYLGWYTRTPDGPFLNPSFRFRPGAVACHIHSFSATTVRSETSEWCGPLLGRGAAAVLGNTWEPYLALTAHLDVFLDRLLRGYTLAEAAFMATPAVSWMNVVLGDPLYRPFLNTDDTASTGDASDYQFYHLCIRRYGSEEDKSQLMKAVEAGATNRRSGVLWEALGLLSQTYYPDDLKRAAQFFEKAAKAYSKDEDKIRAYLQVPDMQRRHNVMDGAVMDLKRIISEYPREPATEAARMWLNTLQPPAPPPPPPPARR
jgi:uncharacterized protein (TIGR03790 family)